MEAAQHDGFQPLHLVAAAEIHEFGGDGSFHAANPIPEIGAQDQGTADDVGPMCHLVDAAKNFPERVIAEEVVFAAHVQPFTQTAVQRAALFAVMDEGLFGEGAGFPAFRAGAQHGDQVNAARPDGRIASDGLITLTAEHLAHTGDVLDADELIVVT